MGKHGDSNYKAINQNIAALDETIRKIFNVAIRIRKEQKATIQPQADKLKAYFNFKFCKIRKTSFVIAVLGLLVFLLTIFCMEQQNDHTILNYECRKRSIYHDTLNNSGSNAFSSREPSE